jgi:hypothetical protein
LWEIADSHRHFISKMSRMTHRRSRLENACGKESPVNKAQIMFHHTVFDAKSNWRKAILEEILDLRRV